jgi:hypothetical protein
MVRAGVLAGSSRAGDFSKRPRVSEAEAPADDGDVVLELCKRPERVVRFGPGDDTLARDDEEESVRDVDALSVG